MPEGPGHGTVRGRLVFAMNLAEQGHPNDWCAKPHIAQGVELSATVRGRSAAEGQVGSSWHEPWEHGSHTPAT